MTNREKLQFRAHFFHRAGSNVEMFAQLFDQLPDTCFYIKDTAGRIVALNRRNCEICNIKNEIDAIGMRSCDLFPQTLAETYMSDDQTVIRSGRPMINAISPYPMDLSSTSEVKSIYPIRNRRGSTIGVACAYRLTKDPDLVPSWHGRLQLVTRYMQEHYMEQIPLCTFAKLIGASTSKFSRIFVQTFNTTPGRYLTSVRLSAARNLLDSTSRTLVEIAQETGFYDLSHFSRLFKKERGITPGEYRARHRKLQA